MKRWMLAGSSALALISATGALRADVTPEDVWANWKSMAEGTGQTITADSEGRDGNALVVKGLTMAMDQEGGKFSGKIDELKFTDKGDGTVEITMSDTYSVTVDTPDMGNGNNAAAMKLDISAPGMVTTASGTPDAVSYALDAPNLTVHLEGAETADPTKGAITLDAKLDGTSGTYKVGKADAGQSIDYQIASKSAEIAATVKDSTDGTDVALKVNVADLAGTSSGLFLGAEAMKDMAAALNAGFALKSAFTYGAGSYEVNATDAGQPAKVSGAIGSGDFSLALDKSGIDMASSSKDVTLAIESPSIPLPDLSGAYGEAGFNFKMPLQKSDAPADFALGVKLIDFKVSDSLWGMIDPGAALPHDPATLILDTKGTATLTQDLTATQGGMVEMQGPPGMLNSFDVPTLDLKIAGAELTGNGSFTFDNADMESFAGMPAPTGKLDLKATGVNGLIDKLVSMGLIPQDQAMQGKMMMGMFAQPGDGEDTLVSSIEFKDKKMTINGMEMPMQ